MIIDSHAHLDYPPLSNDIHSVLMRARANKVDNVITIGVKLSNASAPKQIAERFNNVWCTVGVHPHEAGNELHASDNGAFLREADHPKCVAIGEAGLDYFYNHATPEQQEASFRTQISVARELDLPIVIHSRDADDRMAAILKDEMEKGTFRGVMHCFSSGFELAKQALNLGLFISFSGILTFKKSDQIQKIASMVPEDRLLVETDAPYLSPVPYRGKTNEPAFTTHTLEKLAYLRGIEIERMALITRKNTLRLFNRMDLS